jgi:hypothetical protein
MINVTFDQNELNLLHALIDSGVRAGGINSVKAAMLIITKLEKAVEEVNNMNNTETKGKE